VGTLYRIRERNGEFDFWSSAELATALFARKEVGKPPNPMLPHAQWYCHNPDCVVRGVTTQCKYLDGPPPARPPRMACPRCGQAMALTGYLETISLVPADPSS
jgi:hypothetical protein